MFERLKWATVREHVVVPLVSRLGTIAATAAVAVGANGDLATQIGTGLAAAALVGFDLLVGWVNRRSYAKRQIEKRGVSDGHL